MAPLLLRVLTFGRHILLSSVVQCFAVEKSILKDEDPIPRVGGRGRGRSLRDAREHHGL